MTVAGLMLVVLLLLVLRQNVVVLLLGSAAYIHLVWGDGRLDYLVEDIWVSLNSESLLAIPMYLVAGNLFSRGSIARRLVRIMTLAAGSLPGGLGVVAILSSAVFAAVSGSSTVTLVAIGPVLYPALLEQGYSRNFAIGALAAAGTLGIVIPPSIPLIVYGLVTQTSILDLFTAGIVPGLLLTLALASYASWRNRRLPRQRFDLPAFRQSLRAGVWSLMLPVVLLGGIYSGQFSPTEAAAVALAYAVFVEAAIHREIDFAIVREAMLDTARMLGTLLPIVAVALSLKSVLTVLRLPHELAEWMSSIASDRIAFLVFVNVLLLAAGCFFDAMSAIVVLGPLLLPQAIALAIDPVHFGIMMVINLEIGFLTPPLGLNLFVAMSIFRVGFAEVCRAVVPFAVIIFGVLALVTFIPGITLLPLR